MGLIDSIGDGVGDIVDGVMDGVIDVFDAVGIDLAKVLDNDWVKGGLMAVSIFTGGVAIVNGVMQGFSAATAASAANTAVQGTMQGYAQTFMAGAEGFLKGVATGIMNPLDTAGKLAGQASSALGLGAETATAGLGVPTGGEAVAADLTAEGGAQAAMDAASGKAIPTLPGGETSSSVAGWNGVESVPKSLTDVGELAGSAPGAGVPGAAGAPGGGGFDPSAWGGGDANMLTADGFAGGYDAGMNALPSVPGGDALSSQLAAGEQGWLQSLASGAKDFASSPAGMMTMANAAQGWAQGSMIEKRWDEMEENEKKRRKSWVGFSENNPAPNYSIPSLRSLRERTGAIQQRGDQAQAKYGY